MRTRFDQSEQIAEEVTRQSLVALADEVDTGGLEGRGASQALVIFNPDNARTLIPYGDPSPEGDTVYLAVVDKDGNAVSLIQSNYYGFGSGMVPPGLGFCLQDRGALFSLDKGHRNVIEPGKRPFHTIIPGFVTRDGKPVFSFGVMGGAMQPQGHVQILVNMIDFGMNVQEAGDAARWQHLGPARWTHFQR